VPLTFLVGLRRVQTNIQFLDGGDLTLLRRMRAHANFAETVPIVLIAMAACEMSGLISWALWMGGAKPSHGRLMHAHILITKGWGHTRGNWYDPDVPTNARLRSMEHFPRSRMRPKRKSIAGDTEMADGMNISSTYATSTVPR